MTSAVAELREETSMYGGFELAGYGQLNGLAGSLGRSISAEVSSWGKKSKSVWNDTVGRAVDSVYDETLRSWKKAQNTSAKDLSDGLRHQVQRVSDEVMRGGKHLGSADWWQQKALPALSRALAAEMAVYVLSYAFPPIAIVAQGMRPFMEQYGGQFVALAWTAGTSASFYAFALPDETSALLGEVAKGLNKIDLFQTLPTLAFSELVIQAQTSKAKRDQLRLEIVKIQMKYANNPWVIAARAAFDIAQGIVITVLTAGVGTVIVAATEAAKLLIIAAIEAAKLIISAASTALQLAMSLQAVKAIERVTRQAQREQEARDLAEIKAIEDEIAAINREIEALGGMPEVVQSQVEILVETASSERTERWPGPCCDDLVAIYGDANYWTGGAR